MSTARYVAISGGVGGAKLSLGLSHVLGERLTIIANTGDDFEHVGLHISPDVDTTLYTLAGLVNETTGWGRNNETWTFMQALDGLGGPNWFRLGDGDLATHVERTCRLRAGETLTSITRDFARRFGIKAAVLPMSNETVRTMVTTADGEIGFQDYFVRQQCRPAVRGLRFQGAKAARPSGEVLAALADPALAGIIICPSNPWLSVDPILSVSRMKTAIRAAGVPIVAVTPIIAGKAVKGPTAKIMEELGISPDANAVARHYAGLIDGFILDTADASLRDQVGVPVHATQTLMRTLEDRIALAGEAIALCETLRGAGA